MAMAEDAASVLEQFVQDVANLPAEIQHLLEEIQAKDRVVQECRSQITNRDGNIQKFLKMNGAGQANPKDETYCKVVAAQYERAHVVQEEKVSLSEKAALLLDRQIKRLDFKIRDLQNEGAIQPDPQLPSLLNNSAQTRLPPLSGTTTGTSTPLHPLSGNAGPSTTIANNPITRLVQPSARQPSPLANAIPPNTAVAAAVAAPHLAGRGAQRSPSTDPSKRRRLNQHQLAIPAQSSNLRQSSLGPGTPKGNEAGSRASSAQPSRPANKSKPASRAAPHNRINALASTGGSANKKTSRRRGGNKKSGTPASMTGEEDSVVEGDEENEDVEMEDGDDEGEGDDKKYCICHSVSYGNMVACDNDDCPNEWFHWSCVGVKEEPKGKWYCPDCRRQLGVRG